MSELLHTIRGEDLRLEGAPGWRIVESHIEEQKGRIFYGTSVFEDIDSIQVTVSWRASYTGPSTGFDIQERKNFTPRLNAIPSINYAMKAFISDQLNTFREWPKRSVQDMVSIETLDNEKNDRAEKTMSNQRSFEATTVSEVGCITAGKSPAEHGPIPEEKSSAHAEIVPLLSMTKAKPSINEETTALFRSLSERLQTIATYLADDMGTQQIADTLGITKDTLKGYFCQLREKFKLGIPELRELFRTLFNHDVSLRSPVAKPLETASVGADPKETVLPEQFGKEVLQTFSQQERAVASLLAKGLSLSQVASLTNLRLSDVGVCRKKLKRYFRCEDDDSLLSCLTDIAAGRHVSLLAHDSLAETEGSPEHSDGTDEEEPAEFIQFAAMMEAIEEFRKKLSRGYELTVGDCAVRPNGDVVSVSIRVRQSG